MNKRFDCDLFHSDDDQFFYPRNFKLKQVPKFIAFGSNIVEAVCNQQPNGRNVISISSSLAKKLLLPECISSLCLFEDDETLYLGPLVGIFSSGFTPYQVTPIGARSTNFARQMAVQSSVGAVPFLFGSEHIDWEHGVINGFFYTSKGWTKQTVPFPNVVYDRLPNRKSERNPEAKEVKEKLENDYLIPWYNPGFFNKLELYDRLYNDQRAEKYLPETYPFTSFSNIELMLAKYGHVFLKLANGSFGQGIRHIIYDQQDGVYYCRFYEEKNRLLKFYTLENLLEYVYRGKRLNGVIVQQGIQLIRINKKPVDFRVHVNKNDHGEWTVTAIAAKMAGIGSPTTHGHYGGTVHTVEEIFPDEEERKMNEEKLKEAALSLANAIEQNIGGIIGEIGFDLGIDREGKVWMFEANSKPGRFIFAHPGLKESDYLTRKLALAFAVHLTEKMIKSPNEMWEHVSH